MGEAWRNARNARPKPQPTAWCLHCRKPIYRLGGPRFCDAACREAWRSRRPLAETRHVD